ncbi:MAG: porin [Hyphomicrobiales bacterium]|nr:porin [Hyphomicrobiales bacterium]
MLDNLATWLAGTLAALALAAPSAAARPLARRNDTCAAYGPGFVAVAGGSTCIRIAGHVRVEYSFGPLRHMGGMGMGDAMDSLAPPVLDQQQIADPAPPYRRLHPVGMRSVQFRMRKVHKDKPHDLPGTKP